MLRTIAALSVALAASGMGNHVDVAVIALQDVAFLTRDHFTPTVESWAKESVERSVGQTYDFYYKAFDTWPILHKAVAGECYKVIEQMISQGASLNQAHGSAGTPLFVAVLLGHTRMIEFLITNGAREGTNETLIASATGMGRSDLAELLRKLLPAQ